MTSFSQTNEAALEAAIQQCLCGTTIEQADTWVMNEPASVQLGKHGFHVGYPEHFNAKYALDTERFWHFLESTQPLELAKLKRNADWQLRILERYDKMIRKYGVLRLLRHGLEVDDAHFELFYQLPLTSSSAEIRKKFDSNQFSVTRQVHYSLSKPGESIDMVLFVNGLPLITLELKNPWTGQNAKFHGQQQYKTQRDINQPLLQFARCIVHFTVDTDEAYMTTRLQGPDTFFLPFNLGHNFGKGNPPNPNGHKTAYLWEEVFSRKSLANIIQHFVRTDGTDADPLAKKTLYFPRYHQLDVVRKLVADASEKGVGQTYLIQHSAGSGKSNSIAWAAYQLIETYPAHALVPGNKGMGFPLFDSVIVVTDRRLLDRQLRDNIQSFSQVKNIVAPAHSSAELKLHLESGKRIIITTLQKFPFIVDGLANLSDKRFAVIIDEAHSSQGGTAADNMNKAMGAGAQDQDEDLPDVEDATDKVFEVMKSRKMQKNASYFAFTATPKNSTLEKFGVQQPDGSFVPFHLYSMKQAIEEGFILDVLANYTTYRSYYEIEKSISADPLFDTAKAQRKLKAFVEGHKQTISTKAEIMLDHFIGQVVNTKKLKGKAKAMVITQNIQAAILYHDALKDHLQKRGNPFKIAIAFSGKKMVNGIEQTEETINGFSENETREKFATDEYRILVVANKYLTGFDEPKLCAMYVDKRLQGVLAVQALSRLNRSSPKLGKKTEDLFVLDFFNTTDEIKAAFDPFYTATSLSQATDVNVLHELRAALLEAAVFEWAEVEQFVSLYFSKADAQQLSPLIDVAAERFNHELDWDHLHKADFKIKAKQFVKIYGQMASIIPFEVANWEKLFWFLKFLIPKLILIDPEQDQLDELLDSVDLSTYGLERVKLGASIGLDSSVSELDPVNANLRGAYANDKTEDHLAEIVRSFNERFFQGWDATPEEQKVKFVNLANSISAHPDYQEKFANNPDTQNREIAFVQIFDDVLARQRKTELDLYRMVTKDDSFKLAMQNTLKDILARLSA